MRSTFYQRTENYLHPDWLKVVFDLDWPRRNRAVKD